MRVLVLTVYEDRAFLKQALDAGVRGYLLKRSAAESLIQAMRAVLIGGIYVDPAMADRCSPAPPRAPGARRASGTVSDLTDRETAVLKFAALGFTNKEIARRLDIGIKSVETYKARGARKARSQNSRADIVRYAAAQGWLANI